jgi:hypothetical protein
MWLWGSPLGNDKFQGNIFLHLKTEMMYGPAKHIPQFFLRISSIKNILCHLIKTDR